MKKYIFFSLFLIITHTVFSNDSRMMKGSSLEIIDNENTNITMREEVIEITLYKDHYEVNVTFDFYNDGPEENILLGFPVKTILADYDKDWAELEDFRSYINDTPLLDFTVKEESEVDHLGFYTTTVKWLLREVVFMEKNHTYSRVTYKSPYNHSGFFKSAGYIYGTGLNWKGSIGKMTVYISHGDDIIVDGPYFDNEPDVFTWEADGKYKYEFQNIEPESAGDDITIGITPFDIYGEYHNEFGDFSEGWMWNKYLLYEDVSDIRLYTKNQIRLFVNFFYAFNGYNFHNPLYKNYFCGFDKFMDRNDTEYKVNPNFSEKDFNEIERKNIDYLLNIEKMIP